MKMNKTGMLLEVLGVLLINTIMAPILAIVYHNGVILVFFDIGILLFVLGLIKVGES
jgi:hypothetical protein